MKVEIIELGGMISHVNNELIDDEEFLDKFIEWVEKNNWNFFGASGPYIEEENN